MSPKRKPKIVLIEDDRQIREMAALVLEMEGYDVTVEASGTAGVMAVSKVRPDLVLLDLELQADMNGFEVIKHVRSDPDKANVLVVAFTAFALADDRERVLRAGFDGYITKPVDPDEFLGKIARFLEGDASL